MVLAGCTTGVLRARGRYRQVHRFRHRHRYVKSNVETVLTESGKAGKATLLYMQYLPNYTENMQVLDWHATRAEDPMVRWFDLYSLSDVSICESYVEHGRSAKV